MCRVCDKNWSASFISDRHKLVPAARRCRNQGNSILNEWKWIFSSDNMKDRSTERLFLRIILAFHFFPLRFVLHGEVWDVEHAKILKSLLSSFFLKLSTLPCKEFWIVIFIPLKCVMIFIQMIMTTPIEIKECENLYYFAKLCI